MRTPEFIEKLPAVLEEIRIKTLQLQELEQQSHAAYMHYAKLSTARGELEASLKQLVLGLIN